MNKKKVIGIVVFLSFFLIGLKTLSDYGTNWDMPMHYIRGQAYLRYFLTGKKDYSDFKIKSPVRKSIYQIIDGRDGSFFLKYDQGHPSLNGILAALSNYVLYQKLGIMSDIDSYNFFTLLACSLLVLLIFWWAAQEYGLFAGLIASLSLSLYPLFLCESHFNVKDNVEAFFYAVTIYFFYRGVKNSSWRSFIFSAIACGFALGTKFNILFIPFIILPWLFIRFSGSLINLKQRIFSRILQIPKKIVYSLVFYPLIVVVIFFIGWPFLWQDPFVNLLSIFKYYTQIGLGSENLPTPFYFKGYNTYPIKTVIFTTPLIILFFSFLGIIYSFFLLKKEKNKTSLLYLIWFIIPIARVSLPKTSIYGMLRQIMEYIPAMALLAGVGAYVLKRILQRLFQRKRKLLSIILIITIVFSYIPIVLKMIKIHPNQNVYYNPLIGGLKGARDRDYPYWGDTLGSPYKQGVEWLNQNAEYGARVGMVIGVITNIPIVFFRKDIKFGGQYWSRYQKEGEYLIEAVYQDWIMEWYFHAEYVDKILEPVYEVKVDGVPILKVWKNDMEHTRPKYQNEEWIKPSDLKFKRDESSYLVELKNQTEVMRVVAYYNKDECSLVDSGEIYFSLDGENWELSREPIREYMVEKDKLTYLAAAKEAKYIRLDLDSEKECLFHINKFAIIGVPL